MHLLPKCIKCNSENSIVWWKCCPVHTTELGPDVMCETCALELHDDFSPSIKWEELIPPSTPTNKKETNNMIAKKNDSRSKKPIFVAAGITAFVAVLYFIIHVLRSDND